MDIVSQVEVFPKAGETINGKKLHYIPGGKGANQAVAASRLGANVTIIGSVGNDAFGKKLSIFLKKEKIDVNNLRISKKHPTGVAIILVDARSNNIIVYNSGSNDEITVNDVSKLKVRKDDIILATFETPPLVTTSLFKRARAKGATTILNAAPAGYRSKTLFDNSTYLILNEIEVAYYSNKRKPPSNKAEAIKAARKIRSTNTTIVTLGKQGVITVAMNKTHITSSHKVKAVDTTAAGDCFTGAFATAIAGGKNLPTSIEFANAAAALSVQKIGASLSLPYRQDVDEFIRKPK